MITSYWFCLLLCFTSIWPSHAVAPLFIGDTLKTGQSLNSSSSMISSSGEFTLTFISGYLTLTSNNFTLWVAKPEYPIVDSSSSLLSLESNRGITTLQITQEATLIAELFSSPSFCTNVEATLTDSGNFVLLEVDLNASNSRVLWQSFDEPTVALMPGMKLSEDRMYSQENGVARVGSAFFLQWDSHYLQLLIWNYKNYDLKWTSGRLSRSNKSRRFKYINIPEESMVKYNFTVDNDGSFRYALVGDRNARSAWILNTKGELYDVYNKIYIARAGDCDGFNTSGGCQRWNENTNENDGMYCYDDVISSDDDDDSQFIKHGSFRPKSLDNSVKTTWTGVNDGYCKETCSRNCDCLGFDFESPLDDQSECRFWSRKLSRFVEDPTSSTTGFVLKRKPRSINRESLSRWLGIGITVPTVILAVVLCNIYYMIKERKLQDGNERKIEDMLNMMNSNRPTDAHGLQNDGNAGHDLSVFKYASIVAATCNFSDENKLGQGGFGPVYKGKLVTGEKVAVKRLSKRSAQGISEFKNELILIHELQHTNLVQLFGFCIHGEERILIYEYLPNKSLDYFLFDSTRCQQLDWNRRFSIIEGIAQGLLYLHKYSRRRIIHRDLKASNVLLDEMMNPKISDFGLARIFANDEQEAMTMKIAGTRGYMSPEYIMGGNFSTKSDIYSFGVLMLEILSGRKSNSFYDDDRAINLVGYAWNLWKQGAGLELFDGTISYSCDEDKLLRCVQVALLCVEENAMDRPMMLDVISMLTSESMSIPEPTKPAFCIERNAVIAAGDGPEIVQSVNSISNTYFDGR